MQQKTRKSLTLLELVIVTAMLVIAIIPSYQVFINALLLNGQSQETTLAVFAANNVMEKIRSIPFNALPLTLNNTTDLTYAGGQLLKNESITVNYPNGTINDPMNITITVAWDTRNNRHINETFKTTKTKSLW